MTTDWTAAAVGDAIVGTAIAIHDDDSDQRFRAMCDLIRGADIASINLETSLFELDTFSGWPSAERGGSYLLGSPDLVDDLKQIGFDLFARANNHAGDWGIEGLRATTVELDARRVAHAGVGMNLSEATRPVYYDTPKGRVAMISFATTFPVSSKAAMQRPDVVGRPGCNGVGIRRSLILPDPTFSVVQNALDDAGNPSLLSKLGIELERGDEAEVVETLDQADVDRVLSEIDKAGAFSDLLLVNGHTHEPRNEATDAPRWLEVFARQCIDAGAHAYLGHGPHQLRGIEIYQNRPIFYSLGNFIFHREVADPIPAEQYDLFDLDPLTAAPHDYLRARDGSDSELSMTGDVFYEAAIPIMTFRGGRLQSLAIHPIELSSDAPVGSRGTPRLAPTDLAESILKRLAAISSPYGFEFSVDNGVAQWPTDN
jgi:poly-gamma-glutamate capsule biosynthesis protein CapA/YwtB (metallophosphatase superfamily)